MHTLDIVMCAGRGNKDVVGNWPSVGGGGSRMSAIFFFLSIIKGRCTTQRAQELLNCVGAAWWLLMVNMRLMRHFLRVTIANEINIALPGSYVSRRV